MSNLDTLLATPPDAQEYAPYYGKYISLVSARNIVETLEAQVNDTLALLSPLTELQGEHRYAPDKWSVKEVVGHISDTERIFAYRALRISRGDATPIEGFEQDAYVTAGPFSRMTLAQVLDEFFSVRRATLALFRPLSEEAWLRRGVANKKDVSVRALAYITAGHELHHFRILQEQYLAS